MIPLSSRIDKYKQIMEKKEKAGKPCDILHIVKLDDSRESAFLIQDMFPITEEYIEREYTIAGNHLMLTSEHTAKEIEQKARKVIGMLKRGIKFTPTQPDVMSIPLDVQKEKYEEIKSHATTQKETVNGFIKGAIDETIERDNTSLPNKEIVQKKEKKTSN